MASCNPGLKECTSRHPSRTWSPQANKGDSLLACTTSTAPGTRAAGPAAGRGSGSGSGSGRCRGRGKTARAWSRRARTCAETRARGMPLYVSNRATASSAGSAGGVQRWLAGRAAVVMSGKHVKDNNHRQPLFPLHRRGARGACFPHVCTEYQHHCINTSSPMTHQPPPLLALQLAPRTSLTFFISSPPRRHSKVQDTVSLSLAVFSQTLQSRRPSTWSLLRCRWGQGQMSLVANRPERHESFASSRKSRSNLLYIGTHCGAKSSTREPSRAMSCMPHPPHRSQPTRRGRFSVTAPNRPCRAMPILYRVT